MPMFLDEDRIRSLLDMRSVIGALRTAFAAEAEGELVTAERARRNLAGASLNITAAADAVGGRRAVKIYGGGAFHVLLYGEAGRLLAVMEADWLGRLRTGAATALATDLMAPRQASRVGLIGAGRQARTQLAGLAQVRRLTHVAAYARHSERLAEFCREAERELKVRVRPAASAEEALRDADIVIAATKSPTPVVSREWLASGAHVNGVGANSAQRMELDLEILRCAAVLVVDHVGQARREAAEFMALADRGELDWEAVLPLSRIVREGGFKRENSSITVFKSLGVGLEDLAAASLAYDRAQAEGAASA